MEQIEESRKTRKTLASLKSPMIEAIIHQRYVFPNVKSAAEKIKYIEGRFVRSSLADSVEENATIIWIRDYQLTEEEIAEGYVGNYAVISPELMPDGKYAITARKLPIEASKHPQRKRKKGKHPDWGYWVLRRIQKNWRYGSIDEAYADLMTLVEDFPEVSIPAQNKIYTIIYRKTEDGSLPLFRVVLEVEALREGGFTITCKENTFKRSEEKPKEKEQEVPEMGRFASMVAVKRNKRKSIADIVKSSEKPASEEQADSGEES